jgi:hypothetical protein
MKYGVESSSGHHRSSSVSRRSRQSHAKQIATTLGDDFPSPMSAYGSVAPSSSSFADFGNAFGGASDPFGASSSTRNDPFRSAETSSSSSNRRNSHRNQQQQQAPPQQQQQQQQQQLWDENPFEKPDRSHSNGAVTFQPQWPSDTRSMSTLPSNSSMQASFANQKQQHVQQQQQQQQQASHPQYHSPPSSKPTSERLSIERQQYPVRQS